MASKISDTVSGLRAQFNSGKTKGYTWRCEQLNAFLAMITENEDEIRGALKSDLHKPTHEAMLMEVDFLKNEASRALRNLKSWMQPEKVKRDLLTMMDTAQIIREPYGVVLIIGAWNFPFQLTLAPLVGAIAAGNCALVKPSEVAFNAAECMQRLVEKYLDKDAIRLIQGGVKETTEILKAPFDYIFYTGNTTVGKIVYEAAAKHLTPVTLELGGKSPVYVDEGADLDVTAQRLCWGKFSNCGQTCIAPDYVMCTPHMQEKLIPKLKEARDNFYKQAPLKQSADYPRIINERHFNRVKALIDEKKIAFGGEMAIDDRFIEPTVLKDVKPSDNCMKEEIFGPLLPIVPVGSVSEAIEQVNAGEKPLAMYIFSKDQHVIDQFVHSTSSGGVCVNDTIMHAGLHSLPFGGVGSSGIGRYHGWFTFDTFSHHRAYLQKDFGLEKLNSIRYPPYTAKKLRWVKRLTDDGCLLPKPLILIFFTVVMGLLAKLLLYSRK